MNKEDICPGTWFYTTKSDPDDKRINLYSLYCITDIKNGVCIHFAYRLFGGFSGPIFKTIDQLLSYTNVTFLGPTKKKWYAFLPRVFPYDVPYSAKKITDSNFTKQEIREMQDYLKGLKL